MTSNTKCENCIHENICSRCNMDSIISGISNATLDNGDGSVIRVSDLLANNQIEAIFFCKDFYSKAVRITK